MSHRRRFYIRQNDLKNAYFVDSIKTAAENEYIIGKILYEFVYSSLNLIIFHRGLYSKDSFSVRQSFGFQIPYISPTDNPDVVNYIRTITAKIVNFHVVDVLEGFAYEECNRRTRERLVLKFHYYGSINLSPPTFEEFNGNVQELKVSCKSLISDLRKSLRSMEPSAPSLAKSSGKVEKSRRKPRWKIVIGLKLQDQVGWNTNTIDVFNNVNMMFEDDPDFEVFPWKKSKAMNTTNNNLEDGPSPLNEMARIISETEEMSSNPVFYYDCQDLLNDDYYEEQSDLILSDESFVEEDDDMKPLFDYRDYENNQRRKADLRNSGHEDSRCNNMDVSTPKEGLKDSHHKVSSTTPTFVKDGRKDKERKLIPVVTIDDDDMNDTSLKLPSLIQVDPEKTKPKDSSDSNCGSPDMFEDPLEIFEELDENVATSCSGVLTQKSKDDDVSIIVDTQVSAGTPNSVSANQTEKRTSLKMFSISSVQMLDTLMCNILLLNYPPKILPIRKTDNENTNPFKKQVVVKKRRVLVFD